MSNNLKNFLNFKLNQFCNINGIEQTRENLEKVVRENKISFIREAISAGIAS